MTSLRSWPHLVQAASSIAIRQLRQHRQLQLPQTGQTSQLSGQALQYCLQDRLPALNSQALVDVLCSSHKHVANLRIYSLQEGSAHNTHNKLLAIAAEECMAFPKASASALSSVQQRTPDGSRQDPHTLREA